MPVTDPAQDPQWPVPAGAPSVVLLDATTDVERAVLTRWAAARAQASPPPDVLDLPSASSPALDRLAASLDAAGDPWLVPVRVVWLHADSDTDEPVRVRDILTSLGDPRHPPRLAQRWLSSRSPDRCRVVVGEPARVSTLRERWDERSGNDPDAGRFAQFVVRQGTLALERAETRLVGAQYKVPRLVREELLASSRFREGVARLADELGRDVESVAAEATSYLEEMVTGWSRLLVDLGVRLGRYNFRRGYDPELDLDPAQVQRLQQMAEGRPLVFLPTHKSNLDTLVMNVALHDAGLPRTHVIGGVNMAFWPIGPIWRHAGTVFIRRETRGNRVYTWTLREYIGHLVEKRFSLQFYMEGGRSRTGKLLPPRLGLLAYVADAYRQGRSDDVLLVPVAIAYDQLQEVRDFAREVKGGGKRAEGIGWLIQAFREGRGRFGRIYVRFGEPLSLRSALGPPSGEDAADEGARLALHKVALEVSRRTNEATPITATSLVTLALLGAQGRALTLDQVRATVHDPLQHALRRGLPLARGVDLTTNDAVRCVLDELERHHVVVRYEGGPEPVFVIGPDQHLAAAFYRNSVVHFFLHGALAQVGLARASADDVTDPLATFWDAVFAVRDLLKFEFFFEPRAEFRTVVAAELALHDPGWEQRVAAGGQSVRDLLAELRPLTAHTVLRSFLEAYAVVAAALVRQGAGRLEQRELLATCLGLGRQYLLQQRLHSPESLSRPLFANAVKLAEGRKLLGEEADPQGQVQLLDELRAALQDLHVVERVAQQRVLDLVDVGDAPPLV